MYSYGCLLLLIYIICIYFIDLYKKQKKTSKIKNIDMGNFVNDVLSIEKEINGNANIFDDLEKQNNDVVRIENRKRLIKELFVPSKSDKRRKVAKKTSQTKITPVKTKAEGTEATTSQTTLSTTLWTNQVGCGVPTPDLPLKHIFIGKYVCPMSKNAPLSLNVMSLQKKKHICDHQNNGENATV